MLWNSPGVPRDLRRVSYAVGIEEDRDTRIIESVSSEFMVSRLLYKNRCDYSILIKQAKVTHRVVGSLCAALSIRVCNNPVLRELF
jgi:hypothetical protein